MHDVVVDAAQTVAELEAQLVKAKADLAVKEAYNPAQRLAVVMHEKFCPLKRRSECYWEQEPDYNQTPQGFNAWEHEKWEQKAGRILGLVPNYTDATEILEILTNLYHD